MDVMPWQYWCILSISCFSKSMRILLSQSPEMYVYLSVLHHGYIYHSLYMVILSTFVEASHWLGRRQDNNLESEDSPKRTRYGGSPKVTSVRILLSQQYTFCRGETILLCGIGQVNSWSCPTQGQSVLGYLCWLLEQYSWVRRESEEQLDSMFVQTIFWVGYSWVMYSSILRAQDNTL
jgi:hypothetical protein